MLTPLPSGYGPWSSALFYIASLRIGSDACASAGTLGFGIREEDDMTARALAR
jgi:hypothetical protein